MLKTRGYNKGFALPTVLIASVVMLTILAAAVSSVVAVRTAIKGQYYEQLAKAAGEAGVAYAKACLAKNGNVPLWSDAKPLKPETDCAGNSTLTNNPFSLLLVGGGGSGGGSTGGGGGGGGVYELDFFSLTSGSYPVVVGAGGAPAGNQAAGKSGTNSTFIGLIAVGGGGGGWSAGGTTAGAGLYGGSGGGGQIYFGSYGPGSGEIDEGYAGGSIVGAGTGSTTGGGGAGGVGLSTATSYGGGNGGPGRASNISGATVYYGGGGGGGSGSGTPSSGGIGGGGIGQDIGTAGAANTGGGGGGGWSYATGNSGAGGSGVVIISYPDNGTVVATGGTSIYTAGAYKVHVFNSSGTFQLTSVTASSCPTDPRCSVTVKDNMRSTFSIGAPTLDLQGKAVSIPNNGYVELLRESTGTVWRTYRQPSAQAAIVPDLCSGSATSSLGWQNAVVTSTQDAVPGASSAQSISLGDGALNAGAIFFRKNFSIDKAGDYIITAHTPTLSEYVNYYIDGIQYDAGAGATSNLTTATAALQPGCHTFTVRLVNNTIQPRQTRFTLALQLSSDSSPILTTDGTWRVSAGEIRHFSEPDYFATSDYWWSPVYDLGLVSPWYDLIAQTGDWAARKIAPDNGRTGTGEYAPFPGPQYSYLRDSRDIEVDQNTDVRVTAICDDDCVIYMDGQPLVVKNVYPTLASVNVTLTPGKHRFGARIYNTGVGPAGLILSVVRLSDGAVMTRTDATWRGSNMWETGANTYYSYSKSYIPSPNEITQQTTGTVLVVGGGGGGANTGAGGGAGGTIYDDKYVFQVGSQTVTIGNGGSGGGVAGQNGSVGSNTVFGSLTAVGGGYGGSHGSNPGGPGGSGGGAGMSTGVLNAGGLAYNSGSQGRNGGAGFIEASWAANSGGGGGYGGVGMSGGITVYTGHGGPGFASTITGVPVVYAAGGGAGEVSGSYVGRGDAGAGAGVLNAAGTSATANTGSGGGGGSYTGSYFVGGNGGSGVVIIRYKTGTVTATGGTITTWNGYTIHRFTSSGTFVVTAVN